MTARGHTEKSKMGVFTQKRVERTAIKTNEAIPFAATWMQLDIIILVK